MFDSSQREYDRNRDTDDVHTDSTHHQFPIAQDNLHEYFLTLDRDQYGLALGDTLTVKRFPCTDVYPTQLHHASLECLQEIPVLDESAQNFQMATQPCVHRPMLPEGCGTEQSSIESFAPTPFDPTPAIRPDGLAARQGNSSLSSRTQTTSHDLQLSTSSPDAWLASAQACREYLAHLDDEAAYRLSIPDDDWTEIDQSRMRTYASDFYSALLSWDGQARPKGLKAERLDRFKTQQEKALDKVKTKLQQPWEVKAARARCVLAVDAAIQISRDGVPVDKYKAFRASVDKNHKATRDLELDVEMKCSERLQSMIHAVKANKLVALDVLTGTNLRRFACHPAAYLLTKMNCLHSNEARQYRIDKVDPRITIEKNGVKRRTTTTLKKLHASGMISTPAADTPSNIENDDRVSHRLDQSHVNADPDMDTSNKVWVKDEEQEDFQMLQNMEADADGETDEEFAA